MCQKGIIDCTFVSESAYSITERTGKEINRICHIQSCWMPDMEVVDNASDENNENTRRKATVVPIKIEYV